MSITEEIISQIEDSPEVQARMPLQEELEERMRTLGVDRYWSRTSRASEQGKLTTTAPVRKLMNYAVLELSKAIGEFVRVAEAGGAGRRHDTVKFIKQLDPDSTALITVRSVLDGLTQEETAVSLARKVGTLVMDEILFRQFKEEDPLGDFFIRKFNNQTEHYGHKRRYVRDTAMYRGHLQWEEWTVVEIVKVGSKLMDLMINSTGLVQERTQQHSKTKRETTIVPTQSTMDWIEEEHSRREVMTPMLLPTLVPPRPWTDPWHGGYWTARIRPITLVKTYSKNYLREIAEQPMTEVYDAINAVQHTAWKVNTDVLEVVRHLWESKQITEVIPSAEDIPLPPRPYFLDEEHEGSRKDWTEDQKEEFTSWKRQASETHTRNARLKSLRLQFLKTMYVAEMFETEKTIYFPHQLDFRGRLYPVPMFLHPQGADLSRGLLTFGEGKPVNTPEAEDWLAIHGANTFGNDKVSLEDRVRWAWDNVGAITAVASDPLTHTWWQDADKPFQFLAWCFEWAAYRKQGVTFLSHLSIQMDGSCNGLQNFSAALRDPIGGAAVNLTPSEVPQDIYRTVSDLVNKQVVIDAANHERDDYLVAAQGWIQHGITRKECKRPVMTLAYGATRFGFCQQIMDDTITPARYKLGKDNVMWDGSGWKAAEYLGGVVWDRVGDVVVAARAAMDWFQASARLAAVEGLPVRWTTPDGFVALQLYPKLTTRRVRLTLGTGNHWLTIATGYTDELDKRRQANGISPNWVHSMDASHLRMTVNACWKQGVSAFSMIHDSYGCHAADAPTMARVLREEFVRIYEKPVMETFKEELELQLPPGTELPELPPYGSLDLSEVLESRYFFA